MRRSLSIALGMLLLSALGLAAFPKTQKETLLCTLTNKKIVTCCCEQREGKLYCTLAKKTIDQCCCKSLSAK